MKVDVRLGSLSLSDDSPQTTASSEFKQITSIEGKNLAQFMYQTYDPNDKETYKGIKSSIHLAAASVKLHYLEQPLHDIYLFLSKLAKLKGLYDAATQVAAQRASEIERMQFDISVDSPIIVFPSNAATSRDVLIMRLGGMSARNSYEGEIHKIDASLRGIQLVSTIFYDNKPSILKMIDDIEVVAEVVQAGGAEKNDINNRPDTQV